MAADFILTLRMQEKGGQQRAEVHEELRPSGAPEWIIYIHGFRVNQAKALKQWDVLRSHLAIDDSAARVECGVFLWPSDQTNVYPEMIPQAAKAGRKLAAYLRAHRSSRAVLVGHSMGARVALQTADTLARSQLELRGMVLLGAAVRAIDCEPFEWYEGAHAKREAVGFSATDTELKRRFRWGERASTPFQQIGEAVGQYGRPDSRSWQRWDSKTDDHSYWKFEGSANLTIWALDVPGIIPPPATQSPEDRSAEERTPRSGC